MCTKKVKEKIQVLTTQPYIQSYLYISLRPSNIQSTNITSESAVCLVFYHPLDHSSEQNRKDP